MPLSEISEGCPSLRRWSIQGLRGLAHAKLSLCRVALPCPPKANSSSASSTPAVCWVGPRPFLSRVSQ